MNTGMPNWLQTALRCPITGGELMAQLDAGGQPVLVSPAVGLSYPVQDSIPILLASAARPA